MEKVSAKRSQSALEFLMNYGWTILVVVIVIVSLGYLGALNPEKFLPSVCFFEVGLGCKDFEVSNAGVTLLVENYLGETINLVAISIPLANCNQVFNMELKKWEVKQFDIPCDLSAYSKIQSNIEVRYSNMMGVEHKRKGSLVSTIKKSKEKPKKASIVFLDALSDGSKQKDLTFETASENVVYLKIPKKADVQMVRVDLSGREY